MIEVRVRVDDCSTNQIELGEPSQDTRHLTTGIDDDRFLRDLVAEDHAVAAEGCDGKVLYDHAPTVAPRATSASAPAAREERCDTMAADADKVKAYVRARTPR